MRRLARTGPDAYERTGNRLLDGLALAPDRLGALGFRFVQLDRNHRLYEPGPLNDVYFPVDAVCSVIASVESGGAVETHSIGCEGMLGAQIALGATETPTTAICQIAGAAYRTARADFLNALGENSALRALTARYTIFLIASLEHAVACNRVHHLEERCARWLLTALDRAGRPTFLLTHEYLAMMLGVQRAAVTLVVASLARAGAIEHARGRITVIDRDALERQSCACYAATTAEYDRLFAGQATACRTSR